MRMRKSKTPKDTCRNCRWCYIWERPNMRVPTAKGETVLECYYEPPTLLVDPREGYIVHQHPRVFDTTFCHHHEPREERS